MKTPQKRLLRVSSTATVAVLLLTLALQALLPATASAAQITNRKLTLVGGASDVNSDGINDGGSMPSAIVGHKFNFDVSGSSVGAIKFQYCTTAAAVAGGINCNLPTGLSTATATLTTDSTSSFTNTDTSTNGTIIISKAAAATTPTSLTFQFSGVTNPSTANRTFFVRITTYSTTTATGGNEVDAGTVTASTAEPIILTGTMPESLVFCTGATVSVNASSVPDCTTATPGNISFDRLFSPTEAATATSQMAASTNAGFGYAITVNGPTMSSGSNTITAMGTSDISRTGVSQFGMNLVANTLTDVNSNPLGADIAPSSATVGDNYNGQAIGGYATTDNFAYVNGATVANSNSTGTDLQIYTASYIVNVPGSQPAGTYTTTLTYICTATF